MEAKFQANLRPDMDGLLAAVKCHGQISTATRCNQRRNYLPIAI